MIPYWLQQSRKMKRAIAQMSDEEIKKGVKRIRREQRNKGK